MFQPSLYGVKMDLVLHDHCYTCLSRGETSADGSHPEVKHRRKFIRDASGINDMIDGLPEGYVTNDAEQSNPSEEGNNSFSAKRKLSLLESSSNGPSPKNRKGNKIHELLFGEYDDPQYVDGVQIPDTQTVASDEAKSITTSDFGLYINNPSTYSNLSSEDAKTFLSGSERLTIFGNSMSVDSETEILEAASTLMDLARKSLVIPKHEHRSFKKNKVKPEKLKRNNVLKPKPADIKTQKRKYTKRKGSKKDIVKETYSLWTNGNKYDEFEYYATKPLHRSQCTLSSRKSSYRRSQESKAEKKKDNDDLNVNGDMKEENVDMDTDSPNIKLTEPSVSTQQAKPKRKKSTKVKSNKTETDSNMVCEEKKSPAQRKSAPKTEIKEEPSDERGLSELPSIDSPIASSSAMTLPDLDIKDEKDNSGGEVHKENGVDSDGEVDESSKYPHPHLMTRPIQRRGKRKSFGSDDDEVNSDEDIEYKPIKFEPSSDEDSAKLNPWGQLLPSHILLNIFSMVVREEGVAPFLAR